MNGDYEQTLIAWLHDPPDKACDIRSHVQRACRYLSAALGRTVEASELKQHHADQVASAIERLPMPKWNAQVNGDNLVVSGPQIVRVHPLSGVTDKTLIPVEDRTLELDRDLVERVIRDLVADVDSIEDRYLVLWRMLPERLSELDERFAHWPADTRVPDHTIWQHLDTTAGLHTALDDGRGGAILSFATGPVQSFIEAARSVRDLWSGSMILAWLTFQAMLPVIRTFGPTALVYPSLRGIPLMDLWLRRRPALKDEIPEPDADQRTAPCLPNRFVAVVPSGENGVAAAQMADRCRQAALDAWHTLADSVHSTLDSKLAHVAPDWDRWWQHQIGAFFDFRTAILPWRDCDDTTLARLLAGKDSFADAFKNADRVRRLAQAIPSQDRPGYPQNVAGQWQHRMQLSARSLEAQKSVRFVAPATPADEIEWVPPKCSLMGSFEQMGPADLEASSLFWQKAAQSLQFGGVRLRATERLGAVALVKRFAGPACFAEELDLGDATRLRFDDTATVAAAGWLEQARQRGFAQLDPQRCRAEHEGWSGQWLHAPTRPTDELDSVCPEPVWRDVESARRRNVLGPAPAYYAILAFDGDEMGRWLRGDLSPTVREILHPRLCGYFDALPEAAEGLAVPRPVSPALHTAISTALANFARIYVPAILRQHGGTLIYAGGDDVLALLPTGTALACAAELSATFRQNWTADAHVGRRLLMGQRATVSVGLAIVHHKEDLRFALKQARQAEKAAKQSGRNTLFLTACRRSGEHASALCPWTFLGTLTGWVDAFLPKDGLSGASDRWAYHLRAELETLSGLSISAMQAEIRRQMNRSEELTRRRFAPDQPKQAGSRIADAFAQYRDAKTDDGQTRFDNDATALAQFITLCQTASFLARGRDS